MADAGTQFFEAIGSVGHVPALGNASGTIRFEVLDGRQTQRWLVTVRKGEVTVSRRNAAADCVVRVARPLFERIVRGEQNPTAALMRGAVQVDGEVGLLVLFQKLIPESPKTRRRGATKAT